MFIGEYQHSIDEKGRLAMPVKFRARMAGGAVVTKGLDNCLSVYTTDEWEVLAEKLSTMPLTNPASRAFARLMLAGATQVTIDKQGRINLPGYLRDYAGLSGTVVVAGLYSRVEIWGTEAWKKYKGNTEGDASGIAEKLEDLGI
ncbi:MAG: division/cell wall cluster transcriptional repressor MraZ [Patescibacteria group bacterium]|nr:division/cell wall cluster transcriptional repressor MraZ [Patescibacteria group bacterium]